MKKRTSKMLLSVAVLLMGLLAFAQRPGNSSKMGRNGQGGFGGSPIDRFDKDKDGALSADEVKAAKDSGARFVQFMDKNRDGKVDADEVKAFKERMRERMGGGRMSAMKQETDFTKYTKDIPQIHDPDNLIFLYMNGTAKNQEQAKDAYIINSHGKILHKWDNSDITSPEATPGYLTPDGLFLRGIESEGLDRGEFSVGVWGTLQLVDWDGKVVWEYDGHKRNKVECFHHDVELLPNGNILVAAFHIYDEQESAKKYGWKVTGQGKLLVDVLYEIKPNIKDGTTEIVWEWKWMDHVIQDRDKKLPNYGVVADHPEKIDINYFNSANPRMPILLGTHTHINSIDYNPDRDEIMFTSCTYNEIYIIDHSTKTKQAASSRGGKRGKGGDILYRWGNPEVYDFGGGDPKKYASWCWTKNQHDVRWLFDGTGNITVHNNVSKKNQRPGGFMNAWSQFFEMKLPYGKNGYTYTPGRPFGPNKPKILAEYNPKVPLFNCVFSGGGQKLKNGHIFTTSAAKFTLLEHNEKGEIVWFFNMRDLHPDGGQVFKAQKYPKDYSGFSKLNKPANKTKRNSNQMGISK